MKTSTDFNGQISLQSPLSLLKQAMTHIQRHSPPRKLFYSCFSFPVLSCGSMKRDNRKPQSLRIIYSPSIFADEQEHLGHFLQKKRVIKKFLEASRCGRVKQRQRNVQKREENQFVKRTISIALFYAFIFVVFIWKLFYLKEQY